MTIKPIRSFNKVVTTAPDKSITHRAIMFNAFANGQATITNALLGEDCLSTIKCLRTLGAEINISGSTIHVKGGLTKNSGVLDAGNSGTTARLISGMLSGRNMDVTIIGDKSLSSRPMKRVIDPLSQMGANISGENNKLPLSIKPAELDGITYEMPHASAQVKSAVLLAGLSANGTTKVIEPIISRDHTEIMLKAMGANISVNGREITISRSELKCVDVDVCGDISSAGYLLGLALVVPNSQITVKNVGINKTRAGIIEVLKAMGADISIEQKSGIEPCGDITVKYAPLKNFTITAELVPSLIDELPLLATIACFGHGRSVIGGAEELKVKESNRIETTTAMLKAMGADIVATEDGMIINGTGGLMGGSEIIKCHADHRIALSSAVAGCGSKFGCTIDDPTCADISYPGFFEMLRELS